jgi:hypothetical protein
MRLPSTTKSLQDILISIGRSKWPISLPSPSRTDSGIDTGCICAKAVSAVMLASTHALGGSTNVLLLAVATVTSQELAPLFSPVLLTVAVSWGASSERLTVTMPFLDPSNPHHPGCGWPRRGI